MYRNLKIAMTHAEFGINKRSLTLNSNDIIGHARAPHHLIKLCLDITSFGNVLLLFIAMTFGHVPLLTI